MSIAEEARRASAAQCVPPFLSIPEPDTMPTRKPPRSATPAVKKPRAAAPASPSKTSARSTVSGPAVASRTPAQMADGDRNARKMHATEALAAQMPFNAAKPQEFGDAAREPAQGQTLQAPDASATGSTLTETQASAKAGSGAPPQGVNPANASLDRVRVDAGGRVLTTNQGVPIADNQSSLKAGFRGPALLEDFILREKITHFDHERIPERIVHARGSGAHGYFECYAPLAELTRASIFAEAGKRTPV